MRKMNRFMWLVSLLWCVSIPIGCGTQPPPVCTPGTEGCSCTEGKCNNDLVCNGGVCTTFCTQQNCDCSASLKCDDGLECNRGFCTIEICREEENCLCGPNNSCKQGLTCRRGYCEQPGGNGTDTVCGEGKDNCRCDAEGKCKSSSFRCYLGFCTDPKDIPQTPCEPGVLNCPCSAQGTCNETTAVCRRGYCEPKPKGGEDCTGTKADCPCRQDGTCDSPLTCVRGYCESECIKEGCQCYRSGKCEAGLECLQGYCSKPQKKDGPDCSKPVPGCPCVGGACDEGATCNQGTCEPAGGCKAGDEGKNGCPCKSNGSCDQDLACSSNQRCFSCKSGSEGCPCSSNSTCDSNLKCKGNVCLSCSGEEDCGCLSNDRCLPGLKCVNNSGTKQCKACSGDYEGCSCRESADCLTQTLVCLAGVCRLDATNSANGRCSPTVPTNPTCYSPCEKDVQQSNGSILFCHSTYKLAEGCLSNQTCDKGSCVVKGQSSSTGYPNCSSDTDCPDWQACIQGRCYSNCKTNADCCGGMKCYKYVCRMPCTPTSSTCNKEEVCQSTGQSNGYCVPKTQPTSSSTNSTNPVGTFTLDSTQLSFNNYTLELEFAITNSSPYPMSFQIDRISDNIARSTAGTPKPLYWHLFAACDKMDSNQESCVTYKAFGAADKPYTIPSIAKGARLFVKVKIDATKLPTQDFAKGNELTQYQGVFAVSNSKMGSQEINVSYRRTGDGQWSGTMYTFGNFDDNGITSSGIASPKNAFLVKWLEFRKGNMKLDEFDAILTSIQTESWKHQPVVKKCAQRFGGTDKRCFLYKNKDGMKELTNSLSQRPIPSATTGMNLTINVKEEKNGSTYSLKGRIDTDKSLQYPGYPEVKISFQGRPGSQNQALQFVKSFDVTLALGGRYAKDPKKDCEPSLFQKVQIPWLVPGFQWGAIEDPKQGIWLKEECRSLTFPYGSSSQSNKDQNTSLSQSNPIPNGRFLKRTLSLVDGVLIFNKFLFLIYKETFPTFFQTTGSSTKNALSNDFVRYGYVMLERTNADLETKDFVGFVPPITSCTSNGNCKSGETCENGVCQLKEQWQQVSCSPDVLKNALNTSDSLATLAQKNQLNSLVSVLLEGVPNNQTTRTLTAQEKTDEIHYYCEDTDQFDGGPNSDACPVGSKVVYFRIKQNVKQDSCHSANTSCYTVLQALRRKPGYVEDPTKVCAGKYKGQFPCDVDRNDLTKYYDFLEATQPNGFVSPYQSMRASIADAFRYRIKFRSRTGKQVGFTPEICVPNSNAVPYCYGPKEIELLEQRMNCLLTLYTTPNLASKLDTTTRTKLRDFLKLSFSFDDSRTNTNGEKVTDLGFETLNAELKIMLGDDAFVKASASRFDLAGSNLYSFYGDLLEPGGLKLSGALGYEMHNLYLATQYYQLVLDRFFSMSAVMVQSFEGNFSDWLITPKAITSYFKKLIRASTQKARVWSEVAKRYHKLQRPELARRVARRAFAASYIESLILNKLVRDLQKASTDQEFQSILPQIKQELAQAATTYRAAFLDFNEVYRDLLNDINIFGFAPDYIPFPAVENNTSNAFHVAFNFAKQKMLTAKDKERLALQSQRSYEVDNVSFQNELIKIEQNYDNQLIDLCGTLEDPSTKKKYPAIVQNAYLNPRAIELGNPCGWMGSGQLYDARLQLGQARVAFQSLILKQKNTLQQIETEKARIKAECDKQWELHNYTWAIRGRQNSLQSQIRSTQAEIEAANRTYSVIADITKLSKCTPPTSGTTISIGDCLSALKGISALGIARAVRELTVGLLESKIRDKQNEIADLNQRIAAKQYQVQCGTGGLRRIESAARIRSLRNSMLSHEMEALSSHYNIRLALSKIKQMEDRSDRLIAQQQETAQLAINVQAAKNDPNVRIYKNDAIITAERTFDLAIREAYRATLVYEYFTGTSYKNKIQLFLIRMVSSGTYNLEDYLTQLELAYREFLENNGVPDTRVAIVSLRDDILKISHSGKDGKPLTISERITAFRNKLSETSRLNAEGYLSFPFDLSVDKGSSKVSPITVNHKIFYVEGEIIGGDVGDTTGRLYLRQKGTSWVRLPGNKFAYYTLPQRIAVLNPFFNGVKTLNPTVYPNYRLRDRPLANSHWELLLNQLSEQVNRDIKLNTLDDIRLYIYYKDFTEGN